MPGTGGRVRPIRLRVLAATMLALGTAAAALGGCGSDETGAGAAAVDGLLVLTADDSGSATLAIWSYAPSGGVGEAGTAGPTELATPGDDVAWVAGGRARVLAATMLDGTIEASDPVGRSAPLVWRPVEALEASGEPPPGPAWFATWDPEGGRLATIAGDLPGGADVDLTLIDPSTGSAFVIPLGRALLPSAPAWIDGERLVLVGGSTTEPLAVVVDTATGEVRDGPPAERRLTTSADGRVMAGAGAPGEPVIIRSTAAWLAGEGSTTGSIEAPGEDAQAIALALDADGDRLAVAWLGAGGLRIDVHDGGDGWRRVTSPPLPAGAAAGVLAWSR